MPDQRKAIIADRIIEARKRSQLTQLELARRIGIKPGPLNNLEHGRHIPSGRVAIRLAEELGVSTDYILGMPLPPPWRDVSSAASERSNKICQLAMEIHTLCESLNETPATTSE